MSTHHPREGVKMLLLQEGKAGIHPTFAYNWPIIEQHPGVLFDYGSISGIFVLGGSSSDKRVFVLVPDQLVNQRRDEWLQNIAITHVGTAEASIAAFIEGVKGADPEDYRDWRGDCYRDADTHARLVAYWLGEVENPPPPAANYT